MSPKVFDKGQKIMAKTGKETKQIKNFGHRCEKAASLVWNLAILLHMQKCIYFEFFSQDGVCPNGKDTVSNKENCATNDEETMGDFKKDKETMGDLKKDKETMGYLKKDKETMRDLKKMIKKLQEILETGKRLCMD